MSSNSYNFTTLNFTSAWLQPKLIQKGMLTMRSLTQKYSSLILLMYSTLHSVNSHRHSSNKCPTTEEKYSYTYKMKEHSQIQRLFLIHTGMHRYSHSHFRSICKDRHTPQETELDKYLLTLGDQVLGHITCSYRRY